MCQMHPNSDVQLWNFWLWIHILHFNYVWNLPTLSLALFFFNHIEFRTMSMHCAVIWKFSSVDLTHFSFFYFRFLTKKANSSFPLVFLEKTRANFFILGKSLCSAIRVITSFATGEARGRECRSSAPWAILSDVSPSVLLTSLPDSQFLEKVLTYII